MSVIIFNYLTANPDEPEQNPSAAMQRDLERWDFVWKTLTKYVQPDSSLSLSDAVDSMAQYWGDASQRYHDNVPAVSVCVAEQIPYDHPSHRKLADFMLALHHSEKWLSIRDGEARESARRYSWTVFGGMLRDGYHSPEVRIRDIEIAQSPMFHANHCAFVANLVEPEWSLERFDYETARVGLNDAIRVAPSAPVQVRDALVIGAAQFIIYQAPTIFDQALKDHKTQADLVRAESCFSRFSLRKRHPQHEPGVIFHWEDWQIWKHMFVTTATNETYGKTCREVAQKAADLMALQEKTGCDRLTASGSRMSSGSAWRDGRVLAI